MSKLDKTQRLKDSSEPLKSSNSQETNLDLMVESDAKVSVNKLSIKLEKEKKSNKDTSIKDEQPQLKADTIVTESIETPDSEHISFQAEPNPQSRKDETKKLAEKKIYKIKQSAAGLNKVDNEHIMNQGDQLRTKDESKMAEDEHERLVGKTENISKSYLKEELTKLQNDNVLMLPKDVKSQTQLVKKEVIHKEQETAQLTSNKKQMIVKVNEQPVKENDVEDKKSIKKNENEASEEIGFAKKHVTFSADSFIDQNTTLPKKKNIINKDVKDEIDLSVKPSSGTSTVKEITHQETTSRGSKLVKKKKKKSKESINDEILKFQDFTPEEITVENSKSKHELETVKDRIKTGDVERAFLFLTKEVWKTDETENLQNIIIPKPHIDAATAVIAVSAIKLSPVQTNLEIFENVAIRHGESEFKNIRMKALEILSKESLSLKKSVVDILEQTKNEYGAEGIIDQFAVLCDQALIRQKVGFNILFEILIWNKFIFFSKLFHFRLMPLKV